MDGNDKTLTINITNKNTNQTFKYSNKIEFEIDKIKNKYIENFKYKDKDKDKIILYCVDEEQDKNIINNFDELFNFSKEVDENNLSIDLFSEIKDEENNKINDKKRNIEKNAMSNGNNNNENDIIYIKEKEIEELKNENYNLKKKIEYDFERYKNLLFYYEEFIKPTRNEKEKEKGKENNENEKKEIKNTNNQIIENNKNENNENEKMENDNEISNELKENSIFKKCNTFSGGSNKIKNLHSSKAFKQSVNLWDKNNDKNKNLINEMQINFKEIELVDKKCFYCKKKCKNKIYKDYRANIYICEECYKNKINKSDYNNFFEIIFPSELIKYLNEKRKELKNKPIEDFNMILNNIFFDNKGDFKTKEIKEINDKDFSDLKRIYDDMRLINEDPVNYFADYQVKFINKQILKMDDNDKKLINEKLKLVYDILAKLLK